MNLIVYNTDTERMRETSIVSSKSWGGKGILGCKLSMGDEFKIPVPEYMKEKKASSIKSLFGQPSISHSKSKEFKLFLGMHNIRGIAWKAPCEDEEMELSALELRHQGNHS